MFFACRFVLRGARPKPLGFPFLPEGTIAHRTEAVGPWDVDLVYSSGAREPRLQCRIRTLRRALVVSFERIRLDTRVESSEPHAFARFIFTPSGACSSRCDSFGHERIYVSCERAITFSNERWSALFNTLSGIEPTLLATGRTRFQAGPGAFVKLDTRPPQARGRRQRIGHEGLTSLAHIVRDELTRTVSSIADRFSTIAVLLSGGIDSSAIAVAASIAAATRTKLVHLRFPVGYRDWETTNARRTARKLGLELVEIDARPNDFISRNLLQLNVAKHHWLGWWLRLQRVCASIADVAMVGTAAEIFGRDDERLFFSEPRSLPELVAALRLGIVRSSVLRMAFRRGDSTIAPNGFSWLRGPGLGHLLANPFTSPTIQTYCPYSTPAFLALANSAIRSGKRAEKLVLRIAFRPHLPGSVVFSRRNGMTAFPGSWYGAFDGRDGVATLSASVMTAKLRRLRTA